MTWESREESARRAREHPIYGTDFSKPLSVLVEDARHRIAQIRGSLSDVSHAYPGWGERLESVEGLLTCGLVSLHFIREEMLRVESAPQPAPSSTPDAAPPAERGEVGGGENR